MHISIPTLLLMFPVVSTLRNALKTPCGRPPYILSAVGKETGSDRHALLYFNLRALREPIALVLNYGNVPYDDITLTLDNWIAKKDDPEYSQYGQLPSIKLPSGKVISQSGALIRYAAKLAKLYPEDPEQALEADSLFELCKDMNGINPLINFYEMGTDAFSANKAAYFEKLPRWMRGAERMLGSKDFFGGSSPFFSDFAFLHICDNIVALEPKALDEYPALKIWLKRMLSLPSVVDYFKKRPQPSDPNFGRANTMLKTLKDYEAPASA